MARAPAQDGERDCCFPRNQHRNTRPPAMSLFGNLGGSQPTAGGTANADTSATKPLFGASTATTTGLFGGLGGGTSAAPSGTSQPASTGGLGGLFGSSLGAAKTSAPTFPSLGATSTAQPQTGGFASMFSNPSATQQSTTGGQQSSLFNTASTQQPPQSQQPGGSLAQASAGPGRSTHFDHLLERGRKRNGENGGSSFDELPSLQLGLGDIARKVRNLGAGGPSADQARDGIQDRAAYVCACGTGNGILTASGTICSPPRA